MDVIRDASEAGFEEGVLARSHEVPVVVDFWAPWCGPCRMLGPILEKEIQALGGKVELAKINTDENPGISAQFGIRGIPAVKAFRNGQVVAEFVGAQDVGFVRQWLAGLAPSEARTRLEQAEADLRAGRLEAADAALRALVEEREVAVEARELLDRLERLRQFAQDAQAYGGEEMARAAIEANPDDLEARWALASALAARGDNAGALEEFLAIVSRSRTFRDDGARRAMLTLFETVGDPELVREFRRRLMIVT